MKRSSVSPSEWIRHRKLRKKIASAKWYAHKKAREIQEQREKRCELDQQRRDAQRQAQFLVWPDPTQRNEWFAVVAHHARGFPVRPPGCDATQWRTWCERVEHEIDDLRRDTAHVWPDLPYDWLREHWIRKILRQLGIREILERHRCGHTTFDAIQPPLRCVHPHTQGRLWSTSVWNWLWLLTHLGNQREEFARIWVHVHTLALSRTRGLHGMDQTHSILASSDTLYRWIRTMSDHLHEYLQSNLPDELTISDPVETDLEEEEETEEDDPTPPHYVTQPPTPDSPSAKWWSELDTSESESESVPSSLDTFLTETFRSDLKPPL